MKANCINRIKPIIRILFFTIALTCSFSPVSAVGEIHPIPNRIVSLGPILTETIYLLDADEKLVANTTYCVNPPEARLKEKIGTLTDMNVEKIISLRPDLVLANALTKKKQMNALESLNIRVVKFEDPKTFSDVRRMTQMLGEILGREQEAKQVVEAAQQEVNAIVEKTRKLPRKRVFIQIGIKPLFTASKGSFLNEYIDLAGGENIAMNDNPGEYFVYSREKVLQENPDVILITSMGPSSTAGENEREVWMQFQSIHASRNNQIYILDPDVICNPTPVSFVEALKKIAKKIHPNIDLTK